MMKKRTLYTALLVLASGLGSNAWGQASTALDPGLRQKVLDASTEASTTLADDAGGATAWNKLFGLALGLVAEDSNGDGYAFKFSWGPNETVQGSLAFQAPALRGDVKKAFDDEQEEEALRGLGPWDDLKLEVEFQLGTKKEDREKEVEAFVSEAKRTFGSPQAFVDSNRAFFSSNEKAAELVGFSNAPGTTLSLNTLAAVSRLQTAALRETVAGTQAFRKPHTFSFKASYRAVNELLGQDTLEGSFSYAYRTDGKAKDKLAGAAEEVAQRCNANLLRALGDPSPAASPSKWLHTINLEGAYSLKKEVSIPSDSSLNLKEFEELKVTGSWAIKPRVSGATPASLSDIGSSRILPLAGNTLSFTYLRPNEDFANERWVVSNTFALSLENGQSLPFTLSWSNKDEFVEGDVVRGHFGFSFDKAR